MAVVVKRLTQRIVAPSCARSNRVSRPIYCKFKRVSVTAGAFFYSYLDNFRSISLSFSFFE